MKRKLLNDTFVLSFSKEMRILEFEHDISNPH